MTITRIEDISFPIKTQYTGIHSWEATQTSTSQRVYTAARQKTGTRLPKWKKIIEDGGNATTPFSGVFDTLDSTGPVFASISLRNTNGFTGTQQLRGDVGLVNNQRNVGVYEPSKSTSAADNLARARFYKKLYSASTKFQGLTFLGELRETLHMLRRPAAALWSKNRGYLDALSKGKRSNPKDWIKRASGLWLEHSFGWTPLIHDIEDAKEAYADLVTPTPKPVAITGGGKWEFDRTSELDSFHRDGFTAEINQAMYWSQDQCRLRESHIVRYKGAVRAQVEAPQPVWYKSFGFTPEEFVPTAWELLPWSFLVDYFTNIGDILQASITCTRNLTYVNKTVIRKTSYKGRMYMLMVKPTLFNQSSWSITGGGSQDYTWEATRKRVDRTPGVGISLPTLQFSASLTNGQLMNVAALLGQARALHPQRTKRL